MPRSRTARLRGDGAITIARDAAGIPHVDAATEADLYRGLGYCHGRDRALALLLTRLAAQGRMAEHLRGGEELVAADRAFRRLNLAAGALEEVDRVADADRTLLEAYCDGVTRALARRTPWELRIAGLGRAAPWRPADSILVSRLTGWVALAQSQGEMEALLVDLVRAGVEAELLAELFPSGLEGLDPELLRTLRRGEPFVPAAVRWNPALPRPVASNNWVLAPARTASGRALLANDPHLEVGRLPAIWYEVVTRVGERWCAAATMPGLPGLLIGRTNDLAWGATYAFMDATDSWVEDCRDGRVRRGNGAWEPIRTRTETIRRRGSAPIVATFHETRHGTLDGDPAAPGMRLATRWATAHETGAASLAAAFAMPRAREVAEGMAAIGRVESAFNWVLADRHGNIGYQMSGLLPLRRPGASGLVPLPGWDPANDWQGYAAPDDLPRAMNPPDGFLVTANDDLSHLGRRAPINLPMGDSRARRIAQRLGERSDWSPALVAEVQLDERSPQAEAFLEVLRPLLPDTEHGAILRSWDATYSVDSLGATLFERWYRALLRDVFGRALGPDVVDHLLGETGIVTDFYANFDRVLLRERSAWFAGATRDELYSRVAERALAAPPRPWGAEQQVTLRHLVLGERLPARAGFDRGPFALPGARGTPRQGQVYRSGGRATSFAPSLRFITDFGEAAAHTALAGGPSDRRFSRWYASDLARWLAGRTKPLRP